MLGLRRFMSKPEPVSTPDPAPQLAGGSASIDRRAATPGSAAAHPAMAMFAAPTAADPEPARSDRFEDVKAALLAEAEGLDSPEIDKARALSGALGASLLDRLVAGRVADNLGAAFGALMLCGVGAGLWFALAAAPSAAADLAAAAITLILGGVAAALAFAWFRERRAVAGKALEAAAADLEDVVRETTGRYQDELAPRRARMQAGAPAREALSLSTDARRLTANALRFFSEAPLVGEDGAGAACRHLAAGVQAAGRRRRARSVRVFAYIAAIAAVVGAPLLYALAGAGSGGASFAALAAAYPVATVSAVFVAALLIAAILPATLVVSRDAAASPDRFLAGEPARSLVDGLRARMTAAVAEPERALVERYAEALTALEGRAARWDGGRGGHVDSRPELETPYWRRKPEGPRFVDTAFAAAPKAFLRDPAAGRDSGGLPGTAPKRRLFDLLKPPGS